MSFILRRHAGQLPASRLSQIVAQLGSGLRIAQPFRANIGNAIALGIGAPRPRLPSDVGAQRIGRTQARSLANQDHRDLRSKGHANLVPNGHAALFHNA